MLRFALTLQVLLENESSHKIAFKVNRQFSSADRMKQVLLIAAMKKITTSYHANLQWQKQVLFANSIQLKGKRRNFFRLASFHG